MDLFAGGSDSEEEDEPAERRQEGEEREGEDRALSLQVRVANAKRRAEVMTQQRNSMDASWKYYIPTEEDVRVGRGPVAGATITTTTTTTTSDSGPEEDKHRKKIGILSAAAAHRNIKKDEEESFQRSPTFVSDAIKFHRGGPSGGGRAYFAVRPIPPGTLLMAEDPIISALSPQAVHEAASQAVVTARAQRGITSGIIAKKEEEEVEEPEEEEEIEVPNILELNLAMIFFGEGATESTSEGSEDDVRVDVEGLVRRFSDLQLLFPQHLTDVPAETRTRYRHQYHNMIHSLRGTLLPSSTCSCGATNNGVMGKRRTANQSARNARRGGNHSCSCSLPFSAIMANATIPDQREKVIQRMVDSTLQHEINGDRGARQWAVPAALIHPDEILRLCIVLSCNGFESGVYGHMAMINHSCLPNCVKLGGGDAAVIGENRGHSPFGGEVEQGEGGRRGGGEGEGGGGGGRDRERTTGGGGRREERSKRGEGGRRRGPRTTGQRSSRIFATQFIPAGEEITVSYLYPVERAFVARQRLLAQQFLFTCRCNLCRHETTLRSNEGRKQEITTPRTTMGIEETNQSLQTITTTRKKKEEESVNEEVKGQEVSDEQVEGKEKGRGKRVQGIMADVAALRRDRVLVRVEGQMRTQGWPTNGTAGKLGLVAQGESLSGGQEEDGTGEGGEGKDRRNWRSYHGGSEFQELASMRVSLLASLSSAYQHFARAEMSSLRCSLARVDRSMVRCVRGMLQELDAVSSHATPTISRNDVSFLLHSLLQSLLSLRCFETLFPMDVIPAATTTEATETKTSTKRLSLSTAHTLANLSHALRRALAGATGTTGLGDQSMISMLFTLRRHPWEELRKEEGGRGDPSSELTDDEREGRRNKRSSWVEEDKREEEVTRGYRKKDRQWFSSFESVRRCIDACDSGARSIAALYDQEMKRLV